MDLGDIFDLDRLGAYVGQGLLLVLQLLLLRPLLGGLLCLLIGCILLLVGLLDVFIDLVDALVDLIDPLLRLTHCCGQLGDLLSPLL